MKITIGITGASGSLYGYTLLRLLFSLQVSCDIVVTEMGQKVLQHECGLCPQDLAQYGALYDNGDLFSPLASGSYKSDGMVVAPCSMNTLGGIAGGMGGSLLSRCAAVTLKERRPLVLLVRETPFSTIHLENMLRLSQAGGCIMPASPGFYHRPTEIWQQVEGLCTRVLDQLRIEVPGAKRWEGA